MDPRRSGPGGVRIRPAASRSRRRRVADGFGPGGLAPKLDERANQVHVLHPDGTAAVCLHLREGIPVREGAQVAAAELLGFAGASHLHVHVYRIAHDGTMQSIPIRSGGGAGMVPERGRPYGDVLQATRSLRVRLGEREASASAPLSLRAGASAKAQVELVSPDGAARDVTDHPKMVYAPIALWSLDTGAKGEEFARPADGFAVMARDPREATLFIVHGRRGDAELAFTAVHFAIEPAPRKRLETAQRSRLR